MKVLKGLAAVRKRPTMYIGSLGEAGRTHCGKEIIDNCVDEALAGYCTEISVFIFTDTNTVVISDNGRGIPTGINKEEGISGVEIAATQLHGGQLSGLSF
jgi:DNA gyrase subunit B